MKEKALGIAVILVGLALGIYAYIELKPKKSFLKMTDAEKKLFVKKEEDKKNAILNNPNLTQEQKDKAYSDLIKENQQTYTQAEEKAMAEVYVKELQSGNIKYTFTPSELGVGLDFSYLKKITT